MDAGRDGETTRETRRDERRRDSRKRRGERQAVDRGAMAWMQRRKRDVQQVVNEDERITATGLFNVRLLEIVQSQKCDLVTQKLQTVTTFSLGDLVTKNVEKALKIKACASLCSTCNFQASQDERAGDAFHVLPIGGSHKLPPVFRLPRSDFAHLTVCYPPSLHVPCRLTKHFIFPTDPSSRNPTLICSHLPFVVCVLAIRHLNSLRFNQLGPSSLYSASNLSILTAASKHASRSNTTDAGRNILHY